MSTIVEATVPADQFALQETLAEVPDASFEMVRTVAVGEGSVVPFAWASGSDRNTLSSALEADRTTSSVEMLAGFGGEYLFGLEWSPSVTETFGVVMEGSVTLLDAVARDGEWQFRLVFPERDAVSTTYDACQDRGLDLGIERIGTFTGARRAGKFGLTEKQTASMLDAFDAGYYEVPRGLKLEELAERLGLSHQAISERLRRGHRTLIANTLDSERTRSTLPAGPLDEGADGSSVTVRSGTDD